MTYQTQIECLRLQAEQQNLIAKTAMQTAANSIEVLVRQRDGWEETALMYAQNVDFWKAKLAKAVEEMQWALPILKRYLDHPNDIWMVDDFRATLDELKEEE